MKIKYILIVLLLFLLATCGTVSAFANFTANTTTGSVYPLVVGFTDTSTNSPTAWNWSFGNGRYSTTQHPTYQYAVAGKYTVILNSSNSTGFNISTKTNYINLTSDNDDNLSTWLHMNGTTGSTTFFGEKGINWLVSGAAQITQVTKVFGSGSGQFTGLKPYIYTPDTTALDFGSGAGEIEMWVNVSSSFIDEPLIMHGNSGRTTGWGIYHTTSSSTSNGWAFYRGSSVNNTGTFTLPIGVWTHLVVNWDNAGNSYVYVNGNLVATKTGTIGSYDTNDNIYIGYRSPNVYYNGYIDELRISKGNQRWKSAFTTPWAEYAGVLETIYPDINPSSTMRYKTDPSSFATIGNGTNDGTRNRTIQIENIINTSRVTGSVVYDPLYVIPIAVRLNTTTYTSGMVLDHYNINEVTSTVGFNVSRSTGFNNGTVRAPIVDIQYLYYNYTSDPFTLTSFSHANLVNGTTLQSYPVHNFIVTNMTVDPWTFTANFTANTTTQQQGQPVLFNSSFIGAYPNRWNWSWGDGTFTDGTDSNTSHTYATSGLKTVALREYLWQNESVNDTITRTSYINVTASPEPPVAAFHANVTTGYPNDAFLFTDDSTNAPTSWQWSWGDLTANGTTQNPEHVYTGVGTYDVVLTATNAYGNDVETKAGYIVISAAPTPTPTPTPTVTPTANVTSNASTTNYTVLTTAIINNDTFVPFWWWILLFLLGFILLIVGYVAASFIVELFATIFLWTSAYSAPLVGFFDTNSIYVNGTYTTVSTVSLVFQPWVSYLCYGLGALAFFLFTLLLFNWLLETLYENKKKKFDQTPSDELDGWL